MTTRSIFCIFKNEDGVRPSAYYLTRPHAPSIGPFPNELAATQFRRHLIQLPSLLVCFASDPLNKPETITPNPESTPLFKASNQENIISVACGILPYGQIGIHTQVQPLLPRHQNPITTQYFIASPLVARKLIQLIYKNTTPFYSLDPSYPHTQIEAEIANLTTLKASIPATLAA